VIWSSESRHDGADTWAGEKRQLQAVEASPLVVSRVWNGGTKRVAVRREPPKSRGAHRVSATAMGLCRQVIWGIPRELRGPAQPHP